MSWKNFSILGASVLAAVMVVVFAFNFTSQNLLTRQISKIQKQIEARNDGSQLTYEELETRGKTIRFSRIIFQDGSTGARLALFDVEGDLASDGLDRFKADRFERINAAGQLLTLNDITIENITENRNADYAWNQYLFSHLQAHNLTMEGLAQNENPIVVKAEQIVLDDLNAAALGALALQDVSIRYSPELAAHLDKFEMHDFQYSDIEAITAQFEAGYIPVRTMAELAGTDLNLDGFRLNVDGKETFNSQTSQIDEQKLLQLFLNYAPNELTAILGDDAGELTKNLEAISKQDPNDLAIGALETMLEWLKSNP